MYDQYGDKHGKQPEGNELPGEKGIGRLDGRGQGRITRLEMVGEGRDNCGQYGSLEFLPHTSSA